MIHLHNHSYYSLLDGHSSIKDIVSKAKDLGMPAVALTDHGVMYGSLEFYKECVKQDIKPIIGCEVYVSPTSMMDKTPRTGKTNDKIHHHLILIAKNNKGYENLSKIVSIGFTEGFYYDPRVDKDVLRKYSEGLICTSACLGGVLPQELLKDTQETYGGEIDHQVMASNYEDAKSVAIEYQEIFGKENYFIELMDHGLAEQKAVNPYLVKIADDIGATIIATNDAHYVDSEDFEAYQTLLRINTGASNEDEVALGITENELYFKTEEEMRESLPVEFHQAIENTHIIADMCDVEIKYGDNREVKLPYFELPTSFINALKASIGDKFDQLSTEDLHLLYIKDLSAKGMKKRYRGTETQEHLDRRDFELGVISSMGFVDYYLIVADFVNAALERGISVGPGRGSGAGSLIAYLMGITDIEPIEHGLLFERFLNPDRVSYPDFDIDFPDDRRQEMIDYVKDKYGEDHVAMIITFGTLAARSVIRAVGKVFNVPQARSNEIATMVPATPGITLKEAFEQSSALKAEYEKDAFTKHWLDMSMKLEGVPRNTSMHASGVIIADKPISDYVALTVSTKDDKEPMIQLDKDEAEEIGLLKFDFLGLRTQSVIANTEKMVREKALSLQEELNTCKDQARIEEITTLLTNYRSDFSINEVSFDDKDTFELIQSGNTTGVFQLESDGMKNTAVQLIPESIGDITALISIFRPGPMEKIPEFIYNKANPEEIKHINPVLTKITKPTYGILIYQEQIMQVFNQIAGYSIAQADIVRRVMGSKNLEQMGIERELFIHGKDEKLGKYVLTQKGLVEVKFSKLVEYDFIPTYTEIHGKLVNTNNGTVAKTISGEYVDVSKYMDENRQVLDVITRYSEDGTINKEVKTLVPGATRFKALLGSEAIEKFTNREAGEYRLNVKQVGQYITKEKVIFVDVSSDGAVHSLDYDLNPNNKGAEIDKLISSQASYEIEFSKINMNLATAEKLMRDMESFASYAFNKSHGVAYAYIAYRSAYLKTHFPVEYNVALLSSMIGKDKTRFHHYMNSCKKETGIEILGPDINKSGELFTPDDSKIVFGLSGIKHVGKKVTPRIIEERKIRGKFTSLYDFISRMKASSGVNKSEVESLIKAGAFDSLGNNRKELLSAYEEILKGATRKTVNENQVSLLDYLDSEQKKLFGGGEIAKMSELSQSELLSLELEVVGMYVSAHPLEGYSKAIELSGVSTLTEIKASIENEDGQFKDDQFINIPIVITSCKERSTRTGTQMMNLQVQDEIADSRGVLFEKALNEFRDKLVPGYTAIANGKLQIGDDGSTDIMFFKFYDMPTNQEVQKLIDSNQQNVLNSMLKPYKEYRSSKTDYTKTPKPIVKETVNYKVVESRKMREGAYVSIKSSADIRDLVEIVKDSPGRTQLYAHIEETNNYVALSNRSINSDDNDLLNSLHDFSNKGLILVKRANV